MQHMAEMGQLMAGCSLLAPQPLHMLASQQQPPRPNTLVCALVAQPPSGNESFRCTLTHS
jgi:hypothetical protein